MATRVTEVEVFELSHALSRARGVSCAWYERRDCVLVRIVDADGVVGWGEAAARPGVAAALRELGADIVGSDPSSPTAILTPYTMIGVDAWAVSGVAIALDDLRARQLGVPISVLYGGARRRDVWAYASSGGYERDHDPEATWRRELAEFAARGFTAAKLRIGRYEPERELAMLERAGSEAPGVEVLVDANGAYALPTAIRVGRGLDQLGVRWYEEPLWRVGAGMSYPGYRELTGALDIPVAGGEAIETRHGFAQLIDDRGVRIVQPDVGICGGIGEARFVAEIAALRGQLCVPHCWGGVVLQAATLQLLAVLPDVCEAPDPGVPLFEHDVLENPLATQIAPAWSLDGNGRVAIPVGPGLGIEVDEERVRHASNRAVRA